MSVVVFVVALPMEDGTLWIPNLQARLFSHLPRMSTTIGRLTLHLLGWTKLNRIPLPPESLVLSSLPPNNGQSGQSTD